MLVSRKSTIIAPCAACLHGYADDITFFYTTKSENDPVARSRPGTGSFPLFIPECMTVRMFLIGWCSWLTLASVATVMAQPLSVKAPDVYQVEAGSFLSNSAKTPFWLRTNQYGTVPLNTPSATFRASFRADYDTARVRRRQFDYGYGLNVVANAVILSPGENPLLLPEVYGKVRFGVFEAYAGRRRELFGLADSALSSGSYSWSGNALPIPKIQIGIPQFTPIGFTRGWVSVMGQFAHGWMDASGFVNHSLLHQSSLYVQVGKPQSAVHLFAGFNHQAVWGGTSPDLYKLGLIKSERLPSSFRDYISVITGERGAAGDTSKYTNFDLTNRVGNHLGTVDLGIDIDLGRYTLFLYRQNIYETGALFYLTNITDGLNGLRIRRNDPDALVHDLVFEFLNTVNQGGDIFVIEDPQKRGRNDYFNNAQFRDGWSYQHKTIGTPFITPYIYPDGTYPYGTFTNNNRVHVYHVGLSGTLPRLRLSLLSGRLTYQAKFSFSQNLGSYIIRFPQPKQQFSGLVSVAAPLRLLSGMALTASVASDVGELYPTTLGVYVGLRKSWLAKKQ